MYFGAKKYEKIKMSLILTIVSLGTRVLLAYLLAPSFGVEMIWWAIVIGWILEDTIGIVYGIKIEKWFSPSKNTAFAVFLLAILTRQVYNNLYRMCLLSIIWHDT